MYPQQNYTPNNQNDYDFIVNPQQPQKRSLINGASVAVRAGLVLGALFFLLIGFVIVRSLLTGDTSNKAAIIAVVTEQRELLRITTAVTAEAKPISSSTRNSVVTTEVTLASSQAQIINYAGQSGIKIDPKQTIHPDSAANDAQLKASLASGTYDATLRDVLETQLTEYRLDLKAAYNKTTGPVGRELLSKQFDDSDLLLKQLTAVQ